MRCPICGRKLPDNGLANYCCGKKVSDGQPIKIDTRGFDHAEICRTNRCGQYYAQNDTCMIQTKKGKPGAVSWLYGNPQVNCPHDPPMWSVNDGVDTMDARTNQSQRVGDAVGSEEQVRKSR